MKLVQREGSAAAAGHVAVVVVPEAPAIAGRGDLVLLGGVIGVGADIGLARDVAERVVGQIQVCDGLSCE